jgi:transcriptional regulator of acetoin/glycerol metabolism
VTDGTGLARARQRFLAAQPLEPGLVRDTILASWQRSRRWNVAAGHIDPCYVRDPGPGTLLTRSALPVLQSLLGEGLEGQPVSVILTDARGVVLCRLTADRDLERHLDSIQLAPGLQLRRGVRRHQRIGMALESGQAAHVFGHEHYAGQLVGLAWPGLACAAVPVRPPGLWPADQGMGGTCPRHRYTFPMTSRSWFATTDYPSPR